MPTPKKYKFEYWMFKTSKGIEKKMVCVLAGDKERKRMLEKAQEMERINGWKIV